MISNTNNGFQILKVGEPRMRESKPEVRQSWQLAVGSQREAITDPRQFLARVQTAATVRLVIMPASLITTRYPLSPLTTCAIQGRVQKPCSGNEARHLYDTCKRRNGGSDAQQTRIQHCIEEESYILLIFRIALVVSSNLRYSFQVYSLHCTFHST